MLLKLAALGAMGYVGYRYYEKNRDSLDASFRRFTGSRREAPALAGGPLSDEARVVSPDDAAVS
jgi:hypothetical protein